MKLALTLTKTYENGATYKTIESHGNEAAAMAAKDAEDREFLPNLPGTWAVDVRPDYFTKKA